MGAFDDLIAAPTQQQPQASGAFDDLISAASGGPTRAQAFGYGAADAASLSFGDEGAGVIAGVGAVLGGGDYAMAYRRRVDEARERLEEARRVHPVSTLAGSVAGTVPMMLIPGAGQANAARVAGTGARMLPTLGRVVTGEALPYGRQLMNAAAGRDFGASVAQGIQGLRQGAVFGGVYGAGAANDGDRGAGALEGAKMGAMFGAATPIAFQGLTRGTAGENLLAATGNALTRAGTGAAVGFGSSFFTGADPVQSALTGAAIGATAKPFLMGTGRAVGGPLLRAWRNPREAFGNQTGMSIGIPPIGGDDAAAAGGGARPTIENSTLREVDRAIGREGRTVSDLESGIAAARAEPTPFDGAPALDRRLADMGPELSAQMDTISQMPGKSFTMSQQRASELAGAMPGQIRQELNGMLNVTRTPGQLIDDLRLAAGSANDGYAPVLNEPPIQSVVRERIAPLMETPEMQPVLAERFAVEQGRARLAQIRGEPVDPPSVTQGPNGFTLADDINGRQLHELKTSIDDHLNAAMDRRGLSPAGRDRQGMLDGFRDAYLRAMDDALPGYGQVRATRGSVFDAERALRLDKDGNSTIGAHILKMEPDEIARFMRETVTNTGRRRPTTEFEREAYRAGVANEIMRRIDDYVSAASDKVRNAGEVLDRVGLQNRLKAAFGDSDAIQSFLDRAIQRAEMLRRAGGWTRGAQTARRGFRGADRMVASLVEGGGVNPASITGSILKPTYQALRGRVVERENDALGSALLRRIDGGSPEDEAYLSELLRRLQQLERDRSNRAIGSGRDAALGGVQGGGTLDDQAY